MLIYTLFTYLLRSVGLTEPPNPRVAKLLSREEDIWQTREKSNCT